jgi:hypothetical protein
LRKGLFPEKRLNYDPRTEFERGKKKPSHFGLYILAPILADALYLKLTRGPFMQGASGPICFKKKKKKKLTRGEKSSTVVTLLDAGQSKLIILGEKYCAVNNR